MGERREAVAEHVAGGRRRDGREQRPCHFEERGRPLEEAVAAHAQADAREQQTERKALQHAGKPAGRRVVWREASWEARSNGRAPPHYL